MPMTKREVNQIIQDSGKINTVAFVSCMQELFDTNQTILNRIDNLDRNVSLLSGASEQYFRKEDFSVHIREDFRPLADRTASLERWQLKIITFGTAFGAIVGFLGPIVMNQIGKLFV